MNLMEILKKDARKTWKWVAIVAICLLFLQTCSKCSNNQAAAFHDKASQETIDSLHTALIRSNDTIVVLRGEVQAYHELVSRTGSENEYLRSALKQSQEKPVIIYRETKTNE